MNNYFCVLPFFSYENTNKSLHNIYCCRLADHTKIQQVQNSIKNKQRSPHCATCWRLEDNGLTSERQIHNRTFDFYADRDLEIVERDAVAQGWMPKIVKLSTSNLCNGTCVTCGSFSSTAWSKLESHPIKYQSLDTDGLPIDWAQIVQLSFVGGEPLLEKENFRVLEKLIAVNNTRCFVSMVTNGSIELNDYQLQVLSQFKNLNICVSIDGVGKSFEYLRYPLKWSQLQLNLEKFKNLAKHVSVSCMISNLNVLHYSELIQYFEDNELDYLCKQITTPAIFSPGNLPDNFKQQVLERNQKYASEVSTFLNCKSDDLLDKFWHEIKRQDDLKGIDIKNYLPELASTKI